MTVSALLQLCRIPNVFTAVANVAAGVLLARGGRFEAGDVRLLLSSAAFYASGMAFNDFFDREVDARERPGRPIPSGAVSPGTAAAFASALLAAGLALAAAVSPRSLAVAASLAAAILLYDAWAKGTAAGPLVMGSCRLLNVTLGLSVAPLVPGPSWAAPALAGLYTAALTFVARDEVGGSPRRRGRTFVAFLALLGLALLGCLVSSPASLLGALPFALLVGVFGYRLFAPLWREASAPRLGRAVGGGILLMPALDATLVAGAGHPLAAVPVLALAGPALLLRRRFAMT